MDNDLLPIYIKNEGNQITHKSYRKWQSWNFSFKSMLSLLDHTASHQDYSLRKERILSTDSSPPSPYLGLDVIPGDDVTHSSQSRRSHFVIVVPTEEGDLVSKGPAPSFQLC